jgi:putative nucleotidyltransferase with HDIG domain
MGTPATVRAKEEAQRLVEPLGRRWAHVQAVADRAQEVCEATGLRPELLVSAAWLHDVGYAPELKVTGFHPLDGARHLRRLDVDETVVRLVAHHSCARFEATVRGLESELSQFSRPPAEYEDALCYCDMTNGPSGDRVEAPDRLDEIQDRYGPGHFVTRFVDAAREEILASVARVEDRLRSSESQALHR